MFSRRGFTLMEVNLAVFVMAMGILAMVGLYPLGFRESQQSRDDVAAAILADTVFSAATAALSATNCAWSDWKNVIHASSGFSGDNCIVPANGWEAYTRGRGQDFMPKGKGSLKSTANSAIQQLLNGIYKNGSGNPATDAQRAFSALDELGYAFVATPGRRKNEQGVEGWDFSRICLSFRSTRRPMQLFAQPIFYTEVHFQGMR